MPGVEEADDAHRLDKMMLVDVAFESSQLAKLATCHSVGPSTYNIHMTAEKTASPLRHHSPAIDRGSESRSPDSGRLLDSFPDAPLERCVRYPSDAFFSQSTSLTE